VHLVKIWNAKLAVFKLSMCHLMWILTQVSSLMCAPSVPVYNSELLNLPSLEYHNYCGELCNDWRQLRHSSMWMSFNGSIICAFYFSNGHLNSRQMVYCMKYSIDHTSTQIVTITFLSVGMTEICCGKYFNHTNKEILKCIMSDFYLLAFTNSILWVC
jgi:hypothetical protein